MPTTFPDYTVPQPDLASTAARYDEFHTQLAAATSAADCLTIVADWDQLLCEFKEWGSVTYIRFQQDTRNADYKAAKDELDAIAPKYADLETKFKQALLDSPFRIELEGSLTPTLFAKWECNTKGFAPVIEDDMAAEELRRIHLSAYLQFLPYGGSIAHFPHLVYAKPDASPEERNEMWKEIEQIYLPWFDYDDLPAESSGRLWQMKAHIYQCPFYYVDYCLALTGAMQFWSKSRTDDAGAMKSYAELCTLGGSKTYTGLLASAGLRSPFGAGCLDDVVQDAKRYLA